ncbi:MAG: hypothetical protein MI922_28885, partial [Bacteroidales bacterium]|nr:hypothetical protein [Bacteroidales bacterium]
MKKYALILLALNSLCISAQPWLYNQNKSPGHLKSAEGELSLVENKKAFDHYWQSRSYEKGKGYKQFLRWYHFMEPRVDEDNQLDNQALLDALLTQQQQTGIGNVTWKSVGPTQSTHNLVSNLLRGNGRLNCIAFHPTNPDILYVGAPSGGIWKSSDGGQSWNTTSDFLSAIGVSDIVVSHENPNHIYVATGDRDGSDAYAIGILKSEDGGETWNTTGLTINYSNKKTINRILMHPGNANIMWAASNAGVYKTTNAWASYKKVITSGVFRDMEINPANPNILLAAKYSRSGGSSGIWRSTDGGESFVESNTGIISPSNIGRIEIAVTPGNPQLVYAVCSKASNSGFYGFYSSIDAGQTWVEVYGEGSKNVN